MSVPVIPRRPCSDIEPHIQHIDRTTGQEVLCDGVDPLSDAALARWHQESGWHQESTEPQILVEDVNGAQVPLESDWGVQAQRAAEDHLTGCWAFFRAEEDGYEPESNNPAIGAFDGCQTCEVREMLYAALPFMEAGLARDRGEAPRKVAFNLVRCPEDLAEEGQHWHE